MPGAQLPATEKPAEGASQSQEETDSGGRTLFDALRMTLQFGKEYMDEIPLVGEPGNFRFSKQKDPAAGQTKGLIASSNIGTPGQSRAASAAPPAPSSPPAVQKDSKTGDKVASMPDGPGKPKRRKSRPGDSSP